ncbi:MAG TPA: hypothetical protein VK972_09125, partial [Wenzhouxiangella sp.]|nr:hypothetical protein [Wenzhouxiangella sp.]
MQFTDTEAAPVAVDGCGPASAIEARALRSYEARKIPSHGARPVAAGIRFAIAQEVARGTIFLWLPVLLGSGALIYFALPVEPPAYALASGLALCVLAAHLHTRPHTAGSALVSFNALAASRNSPRSIFFMNLGIWCHAPGRWPDWRAWKRSGTNRAAPSPA